MAPTIWAGRAALVLSGLLSACAAGAPPSATDPVWDQMVAAGRGVGGYAGPVAPLAQPVLLRYGEMAPRRLRETRSLAGRGTGAPMMEQSTAVARAAVRRQGGVWQRMTEGLGVSFRDPGFAGVAAPLWRATWTGGADGSVIAKSVEVLAQGEDEAALKAFAAGLKAWQDPPSHFPAQPVAVGAEMVDRRVLAGLIGGVAAGPDGPKAILRGRVPCPKTSSAAAPGCLLVELLGQVAFAHGGVDFVGDLRGHGIIEPQTGFAVQGLAAYDFSAVSRGGGGGRLAYVVTLEALD